MWFTTKMVQEAKKSFAEAVAAEAASSAKATETEAGSQTADAEKAGDTAVSDQQGADMAEGGDAPGADAPEQPSCAKAEEEKTVQQKPAEPDWKTLYAVTLADFDNYKKRAARDREETYRYAEADILKDVLPAVDNLQLALSSAKTVDAAPSPSGNDGDAQFTSFVKGVQLVYDTLLKSLKDHGAEPFDSVGIALDTEKMEAIATLPSPDVEEGKVSIESKKGWMLKGKVLRAAQVVVSSGKPAETK